MGKRLESLYGTTKFVNEKRWTEQLRALKKYCPMAHKYLLFEVLGKYNYETSAGNHVKELITDKLFKLVHGNIELHYITTDTNQIILDRIEPVDFLTTGYRKELSVYRGVPIIDDKDKFKIDIAVRMK